MNTVNLAPADVKKEGAGFDLPIAVGILTALEVVSRERLEDYLLLGELSLDSRVKSIRGALSLALAAKSNGKRGEKEISPTILNLQEIFHWKSDTAPQISMESRVREH